MTHRERLTAAAIASLVVHIALVWWFSHDPDRTSRTAARVKPIELEFQTVVPPRATEPVALEPVALEPVAVEPVAAASARPAPTRTSSTRNDDRTAEKKEQTAAAQAVPSESAETSASAGADTPIASPSLPAPGTLSLAPSMGVITGLTAPKREAPTGQTLRNHPSEQVDREAMAEYSAEKAARTVQNQLTEELGKARFATGNVPGFFLAAQRSMAGRVDADGPKVELEEAAKAIARDVAGALMQQPTKEAVDAVVNTPLGNSIMNHTVTAPGADSERFREGALAMMAQGESVARAALSAKLKTTIEVTVDPTGAVADAHIIERSGDKRFDESALHFSRKVLRDLPDNDEKALGSSHWKSRWQFTYEPPRVRVRLISAWPVL